MSLVRRVKKLEVGVPGQVKMTEELESVALTRFMRNFTPDTPVHPAEGNYSEDEINAAGLIVVKDLMKAVEGKTRDFARRNMSTG